MVKVALLQTRCSTVRRHFLAPLLRFDVLTSTRLSTRGLAAPPLAPRHPSKISAITAQPSQQERAERTNRYLPLGCSDFAAEIYLLHWVSAELSPPLSLSSFSSSYQSTSLARRMEVPSQPSAKKHSINNVGPSPATARDDDVGLVVARAKKAAASLWMMIHAEVRRIVLQYFVPSFSLLD